MNKITDFWDRKKLHYTQRSRHLIFEIFAWPSNTIFLFNQRSTPLIISALNNILINKQWNFSYELTDWLLDEWSQCANLPWATFIHRIMLNKHFPSNHFAYKSIFCFHCLVARKQHNTHLPLIWKWIDLEQRVIMFSMHGECNGLCIMFFYWLQFEMKWA